MKETSCSILQNIFVPLPQVMKKEKFYVVWAGGTPGIYTSWTDCQLQTKGYEGAKYKSFDTREEAEKAFASSPYDYIKRNASTGSRKPGQSHDTDAPYPTAILENSLAVDAACSGNPGAMEYRGVHVASRQQIFHFGHKNDALSTTSDLVFIGDGTNGRDAGNLGLVEGKSLENGVAYRFTVDVTAGVSSAVLTVEKVER